VSFSTWNIQGFGREYPKIQDDYLDSRITIDPAFIRVAKQLAREYSLAILSNDAAEWSSFLRAKFGLDALIQQVVISGAVGVRKPKRAIYQILLERLGVPAQRCVFVDDRGLNLKAASDAGIKVVRFLRAADHAQETNWDKVQDLEELPEIIGQLFPHE